ncbi:hypothetical protein MMC17_006691 [Xylographa soralifera]|nr:hypothetical protein [Xylographa soralifera]
MKIEGSVHQKTYLKQITERIYHLNCPQYSERELVQRPWGSNRFIAFLQSRWVIECRFGPSKFQIDSDLYTLHVLHSLKGKPGISPFVGIVLDGENGENDIIKGFLYELPAKGPIFGIIVRANKSGEPVTFERREKWCRQIIQGVAEVHSKGFVVGSLGEAKKSRIGIDGNDNAVLYDLFQRTFRYDRSRIALLPPEHNRSAFTKDLITALPQTDIYHLGLMLWRIVFNRESCGSSGFCEIAGCTLNTDTVCTEPHADPIQLPFPEEQVPQYLRDVIAACRAEDPNKRLPAWKLLKMFPLTAEISQSQTEAIEEPNIPSMGNLNYLTRLEEFQEIYEKRTSCDRCGQRTTQHYFHCDTCNAGDYDLCPSCVSQGAHCFEHEHHLAEFVEGNDEERYYASAKEYGRDIVTLPS